MERSKKEKEAGSAEPGMEIQVGLTAGYQPGQGPGRGQHP